MAPRKKSVDIDAETVTYAPVNNVNTYVFKVPAQPANPHALELPADRFGLCSDLRTAMKGIISRVRGDEEKLRAVEKNLETLIGCMYARYEDFKK